MIIRYVDDSDDRKLWMLLLLIFPFGFAIWKVLVRLNPCWTNYIFYCNETKTCVVRNQMCDRHQDCPNDLDESNCKCKPGEYSCARGRCIEGAFLCDGVRDCREGDDEMIPNCEICARDQMFCYRDNKCIDKDKICDGYADCAYGGQDEIGCVQFGGPVKMTMEGEAYEICADNWMTEWSDKLCLISGSGPPEMTSSIPASDSTTVRAEWNSDFDHFNFRLNENCSGDVLSLTCSKKGCGRRKVSGNTTNFYIINGVMVERGAWPWFVTVLYGRRFHCGGSIIGRQWVVTAAHCLGHSQRPEMYLVGVGGMHLEGGHKYSARRVSRLFYRDHDLSDPIEDIALLKLSEPLELNDYVQPICLPHQNYAESFYKICVIIGHGSTLRDTVSNVLLQARTAIYSPLECETTVMVFRNFRPFGRQICMGSGKDKLATSNICQGDSGGPVMCLDPLNNWVVIGVNSYVLGTRSFKEGSECQISFAARVSYYLRWIKNITNLS